MSHCWKSLVAAHLYCRLNLSSINCRNEEKAAKVVDLVLSSHECSLLYLIRCINAVSLYVVVVTANNFIKIYCSSKYNAYIIGIYEYKQAFDT